jgi:hypothetical protein
MATIYGVTADGEEVPFESVEYDIITERQPIYAAGYRDAVHYTTRSRRLAVTLYLSSDSFRHVMGDQDFFDIYIRPHETKYEAVIKRVAIQTSRPATTWDGFICNCIAGTMDQRLYIPKNVTNRMIARDLLSEEY